MVHVAANQSKQKADKPVHFGTYHHSTAAQSDEIRSWAEKGFVPILLSLHSTNSPLRILDAGCGVGFLSYVAAKCFPKARVTGVDLFEHKSISGVPMEKTNSSMKKLRVAPRISLKRHDLTKPLNSRIGYDLVVSNLVFHNIGKRRFVAYENVFGSLKPGGHFILADLFPDAKADMFFPPTFDSDSRSGRAQSRKVESENKSFGETLYNKFTLT